MNECAQVMGRVVGECQNVYKVHVDHLRLHANALKAAFGRLEFVLRELQEHSVMELLVSVENPLPVANVLLKLIRDSLAVMMPSLKFALAVPIDSGGWWSKDDCV